LISALNIANFLIKFLNKDKKSLYLAEL
jgi:hypothetical protein